VSLYERLAERPGGLADLAAGRLRYRVLAVLGPARNLPPGRLAKVTGIRQRRIRAILDGRRQPTINELAALLHAAGYEVEIATVPAGEPRRRALEVDTQPSQPRVERCP